MKRRRKGRPQRRSSRSACSSPRGSRTPAPRRGVRGAPRSRRTRPSASREQCSWAPTTLRSRCVRGRGARLRYRRRRRVARPASRAHCSSSPAPRLLSPPSLPSISLPRACSQLLSVALKPDGAKKIDVDAALLLMLKRWNEVMVRREAQLRSALRSGVAALNAPGGGGAAAYGATHALSSPEHFAETLSRNKSAAAGDAKLALHACVPIGRPPLPLPRFRAARFDTPRFTPVAASIRSTHTHSASSLRAPFAHKW